MLDSLNLATNGIVNFDLLSFATDGVGQFDIFEFVETPVDESLIRSRINSRRGRSSKERKKERHIIISAVFNKKYLSEENTKIAICEQYFDDEKVILVKGNLVSFETREISVNIEEFLVNSKYFSNE